MKKKTTITTETREISVISGVGERELALFGNNCNSVPSELEKSNFLSDEFVPQKPQAKGLKTLLKILRAAYRK